ncbi:MAG: DUF192 domain-containing protein [Treponema sp.]|nr:DUF192 domain-containing protein [Treponema sp.]
MKKAFISLLLFTILASLVSCGTKKLPQKNLIITTTDNRKFTVKAEIAITPEELQQGFMERKVIPDGTGMLFVFKRDQILSFWMKNTPHPLSIAYIDSNGIIKNIYDMKPYSIAEVKSTSSVRFALEVPQGWFAANKIKEGDSVDISLFK